jgi:hypothetical protein
MIQFREVMAVHRDLLMMGQVQRAAGPVIVRQVQRDGDSF